MEMGVNDRQSEVIEHDRIKRAIHVSAGLDGSLLNPLRLESDILWLRRPRSHTVTLSVSHQKKKEEKFTFKT